MPKGHFVGVNIIEKHAACQRDYKKFNHFKGVGLDSKKRIFSEKMRKDAKREKKR